MSDTVPETCADCRRPIHPRDRRLILGSRVYHALTCGPLADLAVCDAGWEDHVSDGLSVENGNGR